MLTKGVICSYIGGLAKLARLLDGSSVRRESQALFCEKPKVKFLRLTHPIYKHVYVDRSLGGDLYRHLRCQKKRRKRYAGGRDRRGQIIGRRPISERPANIDTRSRIGHWEGDTLIGKGHKQAIVSLVERKSGYAVLKKVSKKTSELVSCAIIKGLKPISGKVKTITFDNVLLDEGNIL
ncbi:MAG: IS30 family transposase [Methylocystaceae bacterium]|nr:IS30 family transposase [Methylocystaceae bacterium]